MEPLTTSAPTKPLRILFVDDEPHILEGLRRLLRAKAKQWTLDFASSGEGALEKLAADSFDMIVSDMRMPGMDGSALLRIVQERYPKMVRIILSGHTEMEEALRSVPVAHQFLTKPCDPAELQDVVAKTFGLRAILESEALRKVVGEGGALPSCPTVYLQLSEVLANPDASAADVSHVIEQDPAICARVLHVSNSAFFGLPQKVTSVKSAVSYLGTNTLKNLVLSTQVFRAFEKAALPRGFSFDELQAHALLTANIGKRIIREHDHRICDDIFTAGLLHDVGTLILAARMPAEFTRVREEARRSQRPIHVVELEMLGAGHGEVGAYLLGLWGLPYDIVEAVAMHEAPRRAGSPRLSVLTGVHVAAALVDDLETPSGDTPATLDMEYVGALGLAQKVPMWKQSAAAFATPSF